MKFEFEHAEKLVEVALEEFSARGYAKASINRILARAGMSKGQFYYHFGNKEGLYLAVVELVLARQRAFMAARFDPAVMQADLFAIFEARLLLMAALEREHPEVARFSRSFVRERGQPIFEKAMAAHDLRDDAQLGALIQRAIARGDFRDDLPPAFIAELLPRLFQHVVELAGLDRADDLDDISEQMGHFIEFLRGGLGRKRS
ncbi:MAG: TetR/AcrR family transcriptional regulator [Myxococcales bacterium]|nr:TetR/AcrR family transcriptional regulator [Myxococcales bacterium]